jgi:hypothetical protein
MKRCETRGAWLLGLLIVILGLIRNKLWSRALHEELMVDELVKFPAFHGTRRSIAMVKITNHWSLS